MVAALTRPRLILWAAWVAAAAIGAAAAVLITFYIHRQAPPPGIGPILLALPLVVLQYLVLRNLGDVSANGAGLWAVASLVAAGVSPTIDSVWVFSFAPYHFPTVTRLVPSLSSLDFTLGVLRVIDPLVLGIAQGAALARILRNFPVAIVWTAVAVIASLVAQQLIASVFSGLTLSSIPLELRLLQVNLVYAIVYSALAGVALVAVLERLPGEATAPAF